MVKPGGSLIVFGLSSIATRGIRGALGTLVTLATLGLFGVRRDKQTSIFAMDKIYPRDPMRIRSWVARAIDLLAAGTISPIIAATLPLDRVSEAHRLLETGRVVGKVVIDARS
jgi:NADPH:quinone reductase-like Zn-dependent oxidoreductase